MAKETAETLWLGTDFEFVYHIQNEAEDTSLDITGWTLSWMVKQCTSDTDLAALLTKTTSSGIVIAGTFNATPASNGQRATVTILDTETDALSPGLVVYELKRTTAGAETILAYGPIELKQGAHRT